MDDVSFDLSAASWRHEHADERAYVEALAERLQKSLPDLVRLRHERKWFAKSQTLKELEVLLDNETYVLTLENGSYVARVAKSVGGVILNRKTVPFKEWLNGLSSALSALANHRLEMRKSLEEFLL